MLGDAHFSWYFKRRHKGKKLVKVMPEELADEYYWTDYSAISNQLTHRAPFYAVSAASSEWKKRALIDYT